MSTLSSLSTYEYKVVHFDVDTEDSVLSDSLSKLGVAGWKLVSTYHIHHVNANFFIFSRETSSVTQ